MTESDDINSFDFLADEDPDFIPYVAVIEPGCNTALLARDRELSSCLYMIEDLHANGGPFSRLHFTIGPDTGYFADMVVPIAKALANGRCLAIVDLDTLTAIPEEVFPIVLLTGDQLTKQRLKSLIRMEAPETITAALKDRNRHMLFYFHLLERTPEPIQAHLRDLLDEYFLEEADPTSRNGATHILIQADWHRRGEAGTRNVLDPGVVSRVSGTCGVEPRREVP